MLDQAALSGLNFLIGVLFIVYSTRAEYNTYTLVFSAILFFSGIQNAAILTPLSTVGVRLAGDRLEEFLMRLYSFQAVAAVLLAVAFGAGVALIQGSGTEWGLPITAGIGLIGSWCREFRRSEVVLHRRLRSLLAGDVGMIVMSLVGVMIGIWVGGVVSAAWVLGVVGVAGIGTGLRMLRPGHLSGRGSLVGQILRDVGPQVRWTLPWTVVTWIQGSSFPYFVSAVVGVHAVADMAAARLPAAPMALLATGWARSLLPDASKALLDVGPDGLWRKARTTAVQVTLLACTYVVFVLLAYRFAGAAWVPSGYRGATNLVGLWWVYSLLAILRGVATVGLLAGGRFARVFALSVVSAVVALAGMIVFGRVWGSAGILVGMSVAELLLGVASWMDLVPRRALRYGNVT